MQERPEAIVDLDTATRHEARNALRVTFDPPLPAAERSPLDAKQRWAVELLCDIAEEHDGMKGETRVAIRSAEALL